MSDQIQPSTIADQAPTVPLSPQEVLPSHQSLTPQQLARLTDSELLTHCHLYGSQAKLWKQRFLGLLPEVDKRELYVKQGCSSVFEFAAKVGGVSKEQVFIALRLHERFDDMPVLKEALTSGEVSVNKLARVVSVVTPQTQEFWLTQSQLLSNRALETLVQDTKSLHVQTLNPNKTAKTTSSVGREIHQIPQSDELNLSPHITERLLTLQNKGLDLNQVLGELLDQREQRIQEEKEEIVRELEQKRKDGQPRDVKSRYIPKKVRNILKSEHGDKCAQENCTNQSINIHHTRRFALHSSHNPLYLAPLCKQHHEIAHSIDVKSVQKR